MIIKFDTNKLLKENQRTIFLDNNRFKVVSAGRRFGKSYLSTYYILAKALQKKGNYFFVSPTFQQSRQIIWDILKDKTRNQIAKKVNESRLEIELINGSKIFLKGADRPDTMRGVSLSGVVLDEFGTMRNPELVWSEVLRPSLSDQLGWAVFISSPKGRNYFYQLYNDSKTNEDWNGWQFTTLQGGYVPESEIITAMNEMDERTFRQEYEASFESYSGLVCPYYDRDLNNTNEVYNEYDTLIFGIDMNVNKMPCAVFVQRNKELHLIDFLFGSFNTTELMETIKIKYPNNRKIFHTDASGTANKSSAGGQTDINIIRSYGWTVMNLNRNPNIIDRVNAFNSMVKSTDGTRRFFANNKLKKVVETLENHSFDDNGLPNKKHEYYDDVFDAISYGVYPYSEMSIQKSFKVQVSTY